MPEGGDWKDLLKAASEGDVDKARYHVLHGVDPNFQHPEYFTAPIFEAIRNGHLTIVRILVEEGTADPNLMEDMSDSIPMEVALDIGQHQIADFLAPYLPADSPFKPKHVLVTGGSRGIGKAICHLLPKKGHNVVFTCRRQEAGMRVQDELREETGNSKVNFVVGDLSTVAKANGQVTAIKTTFPTMNVLIHNAGVWPTEKEVNEDGLEVSFAVNYLGQYILNEGLRSVLEKNGPSRIVLVSAGLYEFGNADISQTPFGKDFSPIKTYRHTKQCGIIGMLNEAKKLEGTNVTICGAHPGVIKTDLGSPSNRCLAGLLRAVKLFWASPSDGAVVPVWLATSKEEHHGKYYHGYGRTSRNYICVGSNSAA